MNERPKGSNADEWAAFLSENCGTDSIGFVAVQIAEAIEAAVAQREAEVKSVLADIAKISRENDRLQAENAELKSEIESMHLQAEDIQGQST